MHLRFSPDLESPLSSIESYPTWFRLRSTDLRRRGCAPPRREVCPGSDRLHHVQRRVSLRSCPRPWPCRWACQTIERHCDSLTRPRTRSPAGSHSTTARSGKRPGQTKTKERSLAQIQALPWLPGCLPAAPRHAYATRRGRSACGGAAAGGQAWRGHLSEERKHRGTAPV